MLVKAILVSIICVVFFVLTILLVISELSPKGKWFCKRFGWHRNRDVEWTENDGCSEHGKCKRCGKDVMMDGNGGWF